MWWTDRKKQQKTAQCRKPPHRRWQFEDSSMGVLRVLLGGPTLGVKDVDAMIVVLNERSMIDSSNEIVFDFAAIDMIGPHWTVVLAILVRFALARGIKCHMAALHGQPAAVVSMYHKSSRIKCSIGTENQTSRAA